MGKKNKEYQLKLKRSKRFVLFKMFLSIFKKRPQIVNYSGTELADQAIYISNHAGANGPFTYELYFPKRLTCWGAHEMCGNFKTRWNYLYHVFYRQKLHWGKFRAFTVATLFAPISLPIYRAIGLIGTYTDSRFMASVKISCRILDENSALIIFPENSEEGYKVPPQEFNHGFIAMAKMYKRLRKIDVPVFPLYFNPKASQIAVGEPIYINKLLDEGVNEDEICARCVDACAQMYQKTLEKQKRRKSSAK